MSVLPANNAIMEGVLLAGLLIGHAAIALGFLSRVHALGPASRWMQRHPALPLLLPALIAAWLGWLLLTRPIGLWPAEARAYGLVCNVVGWVVVPASIIGAGLPTAAGGSDRT